MTHADATRRIAQAVFLLAAALLIHACGSERAAEQVAEGGSRGGATAAENAATEDASETTAAAGAATDDPPGGSAAAPGDAQALEAAVRAALEAEGNDPDMFPMRTAFAQVDDDGELDGLVLLQGTACGTGGCPLYVFRGGADGFALDSRVSLVRGPFIVAENRTDGWRDLILRVSGGGATPATVALQHGADGYPANPSLLPPMVDEGPFAGEVVFAYGDLGAIAELAGEYPRDVDLWNRDFLAPRLRPLLGADFDAFVERMQTQGPIQEDGGVYYVIGNRDNDGGSDAAMLLADPERDVVMAWMLVDGEVRTLREVPIELGLPRDVEATLANWGG